MKKTKFIPKVALILLFACLFTLLAGCTTPTTPTDPTEPDSVLFNGLTEFVAEPFADYGFLDWQYSIRVNVDDDIVYLNDIQYRQISKDAFEVTNLDGFFYCHIEGIDITVFLDKIQNSEPLYVWATETKSSIGQQIAVYDKDGAYYFLSVYDTSEVVRIHYIEYTTVGEI